MMILIPMYGEDAPWCVMIDASPETFDCIETRRSIFAQLKIDYPDLGCMEFGDAIYMEWIEGFWGTEYESYHYQYDDEMIVLPETFVLPTRSIMRVSCPRMEICEGGVHLVCQDRHISTRYSTREFTVEDLRQAIDSFQGRAA